MKTTAFETFLQRSQIDLNILQCVCRLYNRHAGQIVTINGLQNTAHLNGLAGAIVGDPDGPQASPPRKLVCLLSGRLLCLKDSCTTVLVHPSELAASQGVPAEQREVDETFQRIVLQYGAQGLDVLLHLVTNGPEQLQNHAVCPYPITPCALIPLYPVTAPHVFYFWFLPHAVRSLLSNVYPSHNRSHHSAVLSLASQPGYPFSRPSL